MDKDSVLQITKGVSMVKKAEFANSFTKVTLTELLEFLPEEGSQIEMIRCAVRIIDNLSEHTIRAVRSAENKEKAGCEN